MSGRILHVVTALGVGGVEIWLLELLRHMRALEARGHPVEEMDILMSGGKRSRLDDHAAALGARLHYVTFSRRGYLRFTLKVRRILRERCFTAIHDHQDYSSAWHFLAGAGLLPTVRIVHVHNPLASLHANTNTFARKIFFRAGRRIIRETATHVLGTSGQLLDEYGVTATAFPRQEIRSLHCGFDVGRFAIAARDANQSVCAELGWPDESRIVLFAGRLDGMDSNDPAWNHKNPEFALDVVRTAITSGTDMRFIVAGDGDEMRARLEKRVTDWGLSDRIAFVGPRMDLPRLMKASRVFLFPSSEEGLGMVAVEAQAAGLRVLASDSVPREVRVVEGLVNFMPLANGPGRWAAEVSRLMNLPCFDDAAAREAVRDSAFSIDRSYAALRRIYSGRATVPPT